MMRTGDIFQGAPVTISDRTPELYLPTDMGRHIPVEELSMEELQRGLCQKCAGDVNVCKTCPGGCRFGREIVRRMSDGMDT